jgi:pimeloyl-ACP methyl ester carboxylesterase
MGDDKMNASRTFKVALIAAALSFALAGCSVENQPSGNEPVAANRAGAAEPALATADRTGAAQVPGGEIAYQVYGDLSSGKTPLLVLHGSFMSGDTMRPLFQPFLASRPVIAVDARGHGGSTEFAGPTTYEAMADDAAAVLAALGVERADVMGYSMGGTASLFLAARHPNRIGKQIILAAPSRRDGWYPEVLQAMAKASPATFAGSPIEAEYRRLSPNPDQFPTFVDDVLGLEKRDYGSANEAVRGIKGKTMIIVGDADGVHLDHAIELFRLRGGGDRKAAAQGFIADSPRARLAILPATSHVGITAEPERIAALALPFLDDRAPPRAKSFFEGMDAPPSAAPAGAE